MTSEHEALTQRDNVNELIDWQAIEHLLCDSHAKRRGNTAWPPLVYVQGAIATKLV